MTDVMEQPFAPIETPARPVEPFEIHRRRWLYVTVVVLPLAVAAAYGWVAYDRGDVVLAAVAGVLVLLAACFVPSLRDLRAPLLVADEHGVRLQGSQGWVGMLWSEIEQIEVRARRGLRGPRLTFLSDQAPDHYAVPLGLVTDCSAARAEIELAHRRDAGRY